MADTPTPRAAILDRITEAEVCEWLQARLAEANQSCKHEIACIDQTAWSDGRTRFTAHGRVNGSINGCGYDMESISIALNALAADIASKPTKAEEKRRQAAALIAEAEALEAEGAE